VATEGKPFNPNAEILPSPEELRGKTLTDVKTAEDREADSLRPEMSLIVLR
jgi:hypothetical protein